jgi:caa(3)-type oxidase subunit IV
VPTDEPGVPILPTRTYVLVWLGLLALTAATVAVARWRLLESYSVLGSLGIASVKAGLVLAWFMQDRKSTRLNSSHNPASRMPSSA